MVPEVPKRSRARAVSSGLISMIRRKVRQRLALGSRIAFGVGRPERAQAKTSAGKAAEAPESLAKTTPAGSNLVPLSPAGSLRRRASPAWSGGWRSGRAPRFAVPLLYTGEGPTLVNDSTMRAMLWNHCRPVAPYRVDLRTGRPVREAEGRRRP